MDRIEELTNIFVNPRNVLVRKTNAYHLLYIVNVKVGRLVQLNTSLSLYECRCHIGQSEEDKISLRANQNSD